MPYVSETEKTDSKCTYYFYVVQVIEDVAAIERTLHMTLYGKKTISIRGVKKVTWVSDNEKIVSVEKKNKVTANMTGEMILRTQYEGREYRIKVFVENPVITTKGIQMTGKNKYICTFEQETEKKIEFDTISQQVMFKSNKGEVAYVDADGTLRTNRKGNAKLTAKINGKTITITLTVV